MSSKVLRRLKPDQAEIIASVAYFSDGDIRKTRAQAGNMLGAIVSEGCVRRALSGKMRPKQRYRHRRYRMPISAR